MTNVQNALENVFILAEEKKKKKKIRTCFKPPAHSL